MFKCMTCGGKGWWWEEEEYWAQWKQECPVCNGTGKVCFGQWFWDNAPAEWVEFVGDILDWLHPQKQSPPAKAE